MYRAQPCITRAATGEDDCCATAVRGLASLVAIASVNCGPDAARVAADLAPADASRVVHLEVARAAVGAAIGPIGC